MTLNLVSVTLASPMEVDEEEERGPHGTEKREADPSSPRLTKRLQSCVCCCPPCPCAGNVFFKSAAQQQ
ncbi:hypothetical protein V1264_021268 [Littorina saxatilis]|uniref:Uncharacterized protein n=1 Tax=Littorina saxatilis TaxID=31220 RepID=A0AAN9AHV0_9CAEN